MATRMCRKCGTELETGSDNELCPNCQKRANETQPTEGTASALFSEEPDKAEPPIDWNRVAAWATRNQGVTGLLAGIIFGLAMVLIWWLWAITPGPLPSSADSSRPGAGQKVKERDFSQANYNVLIEQVLSDTNNLNASAYLKTLDAAIKLSPSGLALWHAKATVLTRINRPEDALAVLSKAIDLAKTDEQVTPETHIKLLVERSRVLHQLGRESEGDKDYTEAGRIQCDRSFIPFRDPQTKSELLDLSPFYTSELGIVLGALQDPEIVKLVSAEVLKNTGVEFDLRGLIRVERKVDTAFGVAVARPVTGIPVHKTVTGLHILHGTVDRMPDGMRLGSYVLHFADGQSKDIPIICGKNIQDHLNTRTATHASVAWTIKTNSSTKGRVILSRFFETAWYNPRPEVAIKTVDFVPRSDLRSYFLMALTTETNMSPESLLSRIQDAEERGGSVAALTILDKSLEQFPDSPVLWDAKGQCLNKSHRTNEALQAFSKAIDLAGKDTNAFKTVLNQALLHRAALFREMGRLLEAGQDSCRAKGWPLRDPQTPPNLIDLSLYYNAAITKGWIPPLTPERLAGKMFARLNPGTHLFRGVEFDIRGLIQLSGRILQDERRASFPRQVDNIKVGQKCKRLHFLHSTGWAMPDGTQIGRYVLHFANSQTQELPIIYGRDLRVWDYVWDESEISQQASVVWTGTNSFNRLHLFSRIWTNPLPEVSIESIDYNSAMTKCAPFLIAITAE